MAAANNGPGRTCGMAKGRPKPRNPGRIRSELPDKSIVGNYFGQQCPEVYEPLARDIYGLLREAWERAVEEVLLNGAVKRFSRAIHTTPLRKLTDIEEADVQAIDDGMTKASRFNRGHDQAAAVNEPVPEPDELAGDITALEAWTKAVKKRRN